MSHGDSPAGPAGVGAVGRRGIVLILGFWALFGLVMTGSLLLSPVRDSATDAAAVVFFTFLGAIAWAALTLPLFSLTRRYGLHGDRKVAHGVLLSALAVVLAALVSGSVAVVSIVFAHDALDRSVQGPMGVWRIARYRFLHDLLACLLILTAGVARDYFLRYRERQEEASALRTQLVESRLQALQARLNPHFLFNTLNAVATLVTEDPQGVRRMIAGLSELLRTTLEDSAEPEVALEHELEMLERYLEIMEIRFRGRLETRVDADRDVLDARVPTLVLQPLVENAMKHGVGRASAPSRVEVTARREEGRVRLTVRDDGAGRARSTDGSGTSGGETIAGSEADGRSGAHAPPAGRGQGVGLSHTRERLRQLYGDAGRLELRFPEEGGAVAEVVLPYRPHRDRSRREQSAPRSSRSAVRREGREGRTSSGAPDPRTSSGAPEPPP